MDEYFSLSRTTRTAIPHIPFEKIKDEIIGEKYALSLVFIGKKRSQKINTNYRKKETPANILSFSLSKQEGEIYISPIKVREDAKKFMMSYRSFFALIFIHGLLHLKGLSHSSTMEKKEDAWLKHFKL